MFVRTAGEVGRMVCLSDYVLLRPALLEQERQHPAP